MRYIVASNEEINVLIDRVRFITEEQYGPSICANDDGGGTGGTRVYAMKHVPDWLNTSGIANKR